ncbi:MAG TPA: LuxR C-terminal-related transcriptional regulator [Candidatus Limnocylindria bacterium]|nr:LuxR C-terminal-related transcriptional regulator [Candidatus Limnocylindria bacterium]
MDGLTPRQRDVVEGLSRGLANKQIAAELGISERAVKGHVSDLLRKYGVPSRAGVIAHVLASRPRASLALDPTEFAQYETVPFMVAVTLGPEHRFIFVNATAAAVAGRAAASLVGKAMREAYPDLDQRFEGALDSVYRTGEPWAAPAAPARFPRADGTVADTHLNVMFAPLRDGSGTVVGLLHIGTEVDPEGG